MTWRPLWPPPQMAKMTNKGTFGIIGPRQLILVCNSMFMSVIYSLVHLKCTQNSHDLKSNMATIESTKMLSLIKWYSSQKIVSQIKRKRNVTAEEIRCVARIQIRQLPGPCFGLFHMEFPSLKPYRLCRRMKPNCGGVYLAHWTRIAPFGQALYRLPMWSNVVGWYHSIICIS